MAPRDKKINMFILFSSRLIRIFMVNHEDTHARCKKFK